APNKIQNRRKRHQRHEPRLPPTVKYIAAECDPSIAPAIRQTVVDQQKERQEVEYENMRCEYHPLFRRNSAHRNVGFNSKRRGVLTLRSILIERAFQQP